MATYPTQLFSSKATLCEDILHLGYSATLSKAHDIHRKHLSQMQCLLLSIMNGCLTSKHNGLDQYNQSVLYNFQGIMYNKYYDYTQLIWNDQKKVVKDKNSSRKNI